MSLQLSFLGKALLFHLPGYGLIAFASLLASFTLQSKPPGSQACFYSAILFAGYVCLRALTSPAPYFAWTDLYCMLAALTLYLLVATTLVSPTQRMALLVLLLAFAVYHILVGLVQFGVGENFIGLPFLDKFNPVKRASGFYGNPDHLAGLLEVLGVFALSITCWSRRPKWIRVMFGYLALTCYIGVAMTASRGGYVSVAASFITFLFLSGIVLKAGNDPAFRTYRKIAAVIAIVTLIGAGLALQQSVTVRERLSQIMTPDQTRFDLWQASIEQWKLQPIVGTGSGTYRFYGREFRAPEMQSDPVVVHNDYLHLLCEYGLAGAAFFLLFFIAHVRSGLTNFLHFGPRRMVPEILPLSDRLALTIGALSAIAAYLIHSAVDFNMHIPANALIIAFVFAILANAGRTSESTVSSSPQILGSRLLAVAIAIILLVQCIHLLPGEYFAEKARVALADEDPAEAATLAQKGLAYERKNPNILFYLGRALGALGNQKEASEKRQTYHEQALLAFSEAHRLTPLEVSYPLDMAFTYDQLGKFNEAEWMYGVALRRDPNSRAVENLYQSHLETWRTSGSTTLPADSDLPN